MILRTILPSSKEMCQTLADINWKPIAFIAGMLLSLHYCGAAVFEAVRWINIDKFVVYSYKRFYFMMALSYVLFGIASIFFFLFLLEILRFVRKQKQGRDSSDDGSPNTGSKR